jgi:hypothetical protein
VVSSLHATAPASAKDTQPNANMIFNLSDSTTKMNVFDRTVPFYQLVISGIIPYTESEINLNENSRYGLLYCLRSGSAPHYIIGANMDSDPLQNTQLQSMPYPAPTNVPQEEPLLYSRN